MNLFKAGSIELYEYQKLALVDLLSAFETRQKALMVMATGLGKTIVSAFFARMQFMAGKRGLFLCHQNHILDQAVKKYHKILGRHTGLSKFYGLEKDSNANTADVLFASFQSLKNHYQALDPEHFDYIIVDESHHGQAPTFKEVLDYFQPEMILGMTATPARGDDKDIRDLFGPEVVNYSLVESIANGWLTPMEYRILNDGIDEDRLRQIVRDVMEEGQRITINQLNDIIFIQARDQEIASQIIEASESEKVVIFCESIDHVENFKDYLPNSAVFHSKNGRQRNQRILSDFRHGKIQFLLVVNMFNEGIDVPDTGVVVFLRSTESETIFLQQLGRGLRKLPGKSKVTILDFVANCERLQMLSEVIGEIEEVNQSETDISFPDDRKKLIVSGETFDFIFNDQQVDILSVLEKISAEYYETWEEASMVCVQNEIVSSFDYVKRFKKIDPKLHSNPQVFYRDKGWPGWSEFLDREGKEYYDTWQEASAIAIAHNIQSGVEYYQRFRTIDLRLHYYPERFYRDKGWPGWVVFLGGTVKKPYQSWQEASAVCKANNITSRTDYIQRYKELDPRLPGNPYEFYGRDGNWPGWPLYLGHIESQKPEPFQTWQAASEICIKHGVKNKEDYGRRHKEIDRRLHYDPRVYYKDNGWPGWRKFLGRGVKELYRTWQQASSVCIANGIKHQVDYFERYADIDSGLPGDPATYYNKRRGFPGWDIFLGKAPKVEYYQTWQEASAVCVANNVVYQNDYYRRYAELDPRLPSDPLNYYRIRNGFPGWDTFLGKQAIEKYQSWQEASAVCIANNIANQNDYSKRRKSIDARLPGDPADYYQVRDGWPGWEVFLDKFYKTWQEASAVCIAKVVKSGPDYRSRYKELDSRLCSSPQTFYHDFPGWHIFLGKM